VATAKGKSDARRNLSLRRALDRAKEGLARRDLKVAHAAIMKAAAQAPLPVRPTRLLWEVVSRWLRNKHSGEGGPLDDLFMTQAAMEHLKAGHERYEQGTPEKALARYAKVLALCPLSPEAIYRTGMCHHEMGDETEASHWLKLVPEILGPDQRRGRLTRGLVSDAYLKLAQIEFARGHRSRAASLALKSLDVNPHSEQARSFIWDLENKVGNHPA
jgi:tetratricopeptide (TPR) repeat protein